MDNETKIQNKLFLTTFALGIIGTYFYQFRNNYLKFKFISLLDFSFFVSGLCFCIYILLMYTRYFSEKQDRYKLNYHFDNDAFIRLNPKKVNKFYDLGVKSFFITLTISFTSPFFYFQTNWIANYIHLRLLKSEDLSFFLAFILILIILVTIFNILLRFLEWLMK